MKEMIHPRIREYACVPCSTVTQKTHSGEWGLTQEQVRQNRKKYGGNEQTISGKKENTIPHCIRRAFIIPFTVLLFLLAVILLFTDILMSETMSVERRNILRVYGAEVHIDDIIAALENGFVAVK